MLPKIAITMGDPAGIGPEVAVLAHAREEFFSWCRPVVYGDPAIIRRAVKVTGAFLAIGSAISALTKNQVIAFIVAAAICFLLVMSGFELVLNSFRSWAPEFIVTAVSSLSFLSHFEDVTKGLVGLPTIIFYLSLIAFALFANRIIIDLKKAA